MKGKILKGKRVLLRPPALSDAKIFWEWFKDKDIIKYLYVQKPVKSLSLEKKWIASQIKSPDSILFTIINESKEVIGNASLRLNKDNKVVTLGIIIGEKKQWGKGYAGEVINLLSSYVFKNLKYNRFDLVVAANNSRAQRVYEKVGFIKEGVRRKIKWNIVTKQFEDDIVMSILKQEWKIK